MKLKTVKEMQEMSTLELNHYHDALTENTRIAWHVLRVKEAIDESRS